MTPISYQLGPLQAHAESTLSFRLRLPQPAHPHSCVVLLHGVGGNETNLADFAQAIDPETLVVFVRSRLQFAPGQFGWFQVGFTSSGPKIVESEAEASRLALIDFIHWLQASYGVEPSKTVLAGFSQGGIMSASVALSAPDCVTGFGLLSGRILPELAQHLAPHASLTDLHGFIGHGSQDRTLPVSWAQRADAWLTELAVSHETHIYPIGHEISLAEQADFQGWLARTLG